MLSYEEALAIVLTHTPPPKQGERGLLDGLGRTLAKSLLAPIDLPSYDNSSVDGYAVKGLNHHRYRVVGEISAGSDGDVILADGEACRVFTGSRIPAGTESVVMQEDVDLSGDIATLREPPTGGAFIRRKGEEIKAGDLAVEAGTLLSPPALGLIATLGIDRFSVFEPPRVSVVGTGNELVSPGLPIASGQVYESNTFAIQAALRGLGISEIRLARVPDDLAQTADALKAELSLSDVLIVCGGMSVGDHDHVRPALASIGVSERLWRVRVRPGKPFYFGTTPSGQLVFGLPGNPVSVLVTFLLFVRPALFGLAGRNPDGWRRMTAGHAMQGGRDRDDFARARFVEGRVWLDDRQGSHMLSAMAIADGLVRIPAGRSISEGEDVDVLPLHWWPT